MKEGLNPELDGIGRYEYGWVDKYDVGLDSRRGLSEDESMAMIVRGFIEPIAKELPMEYAIELNRLIALQMEGAVG